MSGFNNSFEKAFNPGMAIGANSALDAMRDKIKQEQLKAEEKFKATTTRNSNKAMALGLPDQELGKRIIGITESVGDDLESQKNIGEMIAKALNPKESSPTNIYVQGNDGAPVQTGTVPHGSKVFKKNLTTDEYVERAEESTRAKEEVKLDYPVLDDKSRSAVSAYKYVGPRVSRLGELVDGGLFKDARLVQQITIDKSGDLIVPDGSPLEEAIGLVNDIKLTGFNIAGTAFTGTEKEVAFNLLNPIGKGDKRWKRDLQSFQELFGMRVEAGVEGLRGAKEVAKDVKTKRESKESEQKYEYREVNGKKQRRKISG